jgi:beta-lactamase regulating signal transducer with metallopeptidase domain
MFWFALRSALVFALAGIATLAMRRKSASLRHLVWLAAFVAVAAMPLFAYVTPLAKIDAPPATAKALAPILPPRPAVVAMRRETSTPPNVSAAATEFPIADAPDVVAEAFIADLLADPYRWIPLIYALGVGAILIRYALAFRRLRQAIRHSEWQAASPNSVRVRIVASGLLASPATFGWPRATVLMPAESETWPEERCRAAIQHELAHIERADWVWQCLALAVCTVQWFNPLAWFAAARLRAEAEGAADDAVLRQGLAPSAYAQELLEVARGIRRNTLLAVPIARPGGVAHRIRAILARDRDRSPAKHPAHLAAGTGTLFAAAILGGLGLSAAVAQAPFSPPRDPFKLPEQEGADIPVFANRTVEAEGEFGFDQVQVRPKGSKEKGWDLIGRPEWVDMADAPRPPEIPGRKVREFVVVCPAARPLFASVPKGAEVVQITRQKELALISASYPKTAEVTSLNVAFARSPGALRETLPLRRVTKPDGRTLWPRFAWFEVPNSSEKVYDRFLDATGREIPLLAQFNPYGSPVSYLAIDAKKADHLQKIQRHIRIEHAASFTPILLDPAPVQSERPDAPLPTFALKGGGKLSVQYIESQTPGSPARRWASDGGAPRPVKPSGYRSSFVPDYKPGRMGREFRAAVVWPKTVRDRATFSWSVDAPAQSRSSGYSGSENRYDVIVKLDVPRSQRELALHADYAYEPWQQVIDEPLGGPKLKSRFEVGDGWNPGERYVQVHYLPPEGFEKMDILLEAVDAKGKKLDANSTSGPGRDNLTGKIDHHRSSTYMLSSPKRIARLRLKVRPLYRITLPPLPMHPR